MHSNNCTKIYPWWARPLPVHGIDAVGHTSGCAVHTVYRVPSVTDRVNGGFGEFPTSKRIFTFRSVTIIKRLSP